MMRRNSEREKEREKSGREGEGEIDRQILYLGIVKMSHGFVLGPDRI